MGTTPNLGLPVYGSSDTPDWMDTNNGFEKLDNIVGGAAGVQLDFANPLHVFTQSNTTYTATQTCWLFGSFMASDGNYAYVKVDGTRVAGTYDATNGYPSAFIPPVRIESGSVIEVTNLGPDVYPGRQCLAVYPGEIISDTFVWNEAIVELDYGNPLHSFTSGHYTYTVAGDDEWLCGNLNNGDSKVSINGTIIGVGLGDTGRCSYPYMAPLKVSRGDVIEVTSNFDYLHVFRGTIKGSAPGNAGGGDVLELLDIANAVVLTTTNYTTPKVGCIVGGIYKNAENLKIILDDDTTHPLTFADGSNRTCVFIPGIPKGSRLKLNTSNSSAVSFVPYKYESIAPEITVYNEAEVELDYANPLHTFSSGNLTYTATEDCYLCGSIGQDNATLTINGTQVAKGWYGSGYVSNPFISPIKISIGDVVSVSAASPILNIYRGTKVGSVGNLTGAWIEDYSNVLYNLTQATASYTCTEDGVLIGVLQSQSGSSRPTITINGSVVYSPAQTHPGLAIRCNVKKGDVVEFSDVGIAYGCVHIYGVI